MSESPDRQQNRFIAEPIAVFLVGLHINRWRTPWHWLYQCLYGDMPAVGLGAIQGLTPVVPGE